MPTLVADSSLDSAERFDGQTLREVLTHGRLPLEPTVTCAIQIANELAAVHQNGIVHGDLKPENLLVTPDGRVKILGLGATTRVATAPAPRTATLIAAHGADTALRTALGIVDYMSPERVRGEAIDHRSDIFSLGSVLYEMLSGQRPFKGSTPPDTMGAILKQEPVEFSGDGAVNVSPALMGIVKRCLKKDPEARFQTAQGIASALAGPVTASAPGSLPAVASPESRRLSALTAVQYEVLRRLWPGDPPAMMHAAAYDGKSKLDVLLGPALGDLRGKTVIDFGCGYGLEAIDLARRGAARVIGLELDLDYLAIARQCVSAAGLSHLIELAEQTTCKADVVISLDAFEHFDDPEAILRIIFGLLRPGGALVASFGPPWYHPLGGHLFSVFPWAHLIFSEAALLRWREDRRAERRDSFLAAGLNQMTVSRFERLVEASPFQVERLEVVPIRRLKRFHNRLTREFFTSIVRCRLRRP